MSTTEPKELKVRTGVRYSEALAEIQKMPCEYFSMHLKEWGDDNYVYWYRTGSYDNPGYMMRRSSGGYGEYVPTQAELNSSEWILTE